MSVDDKKFQEELEKALAHARAVCAEKGEDSPDCANAWDTVEEMRAEVYHQHQNAPRSNFDRYVENNPDAPEARIYDN